MDYGFCGMDLEEVACVLQGKVNDVVICRDRLSQTEQRYTLLVVHHREYVQKILKQLGAGHTPCIAQIIWGEHMAFVFPYDVQRKWSVFAPVQKKQPGDGETMAKSLVWTCLSQQLPWGLLQLILEQEQVQLSADNQVYFTYELDLAQLDETSNERRCVGICAQQIAQLLAQDQKGNRGHQKRSSYSHQLVWSKVQKGLYHNFAQLYRDLDCTAQIPLSCTGKERLFQLWQRHRSWILRVVSVLCGVIVVLALLVLLSQLIFGEIPMMRLVQHPFDVIGTEDLTQGVGV